MKLLGDVSSKPKTRETVLHISKDGNQFLIHEMANIGCDCQSPNDLNANDLCIRVEAEE